MLRIHIRNTTIHLTEMSAQRPEFPPRMHCVRADVVVGRDVDDLRPGAVRHGERYRLAALVGDATVVDEHVTARGRGPQVKAFVRAKGEQVETVRREAQAVDVAVVGRVY